MDFLKLAQEIQENSKKEHPIVFITGLGGSGKTTFAKKFVEIVPNSELFEFDWYMIEDSKTRKNKIKILEGSDDLISIKKVEDPINWYNWDAFKNDLLKFQNNKRVLIENAWNQFTGEKDRLIDIKFKRKTGIIVCEGICLLHEEIIKIADYIIFIDVPLDHARDQANNRDIHRYTEEWKLKKREIVEKYDKPYYIENKKNADLILETGSF